MKILKDNSKKTQIVECCYCCSLLEIGKDDIFKSANQDYVKCPICDKKISVFWRATE